ncbi:MAG: cation:proton antiporter, partial [Ilumatobacteraceae bacterium]
LGVSDAIGAFMAGLVLSATSAKQRIEKLVLPLRDAFGALFFFHFGLIIDPGALGKVVLPVLAAVFVSISLAVLAGIGVARINRLGRREAANIAFLVVARGEFALILAALALAAGLDARLTPFVGLYVLVLATVSPVLASRSAGLSRIIPHRLVPSRAAAEPADTPDTPDPQLAGTVPS